MSIQVVPVDRQFSECPDRAAGGLYWAHLGPCWPHLDPCRPILAPSWLHLGPILAYLGAILADLGPILADLGPPSSAHKEGSDWHLQLGPGTLKIDGAILALSWPTCATSAFHVRKIMRSLYPAHALRYTIPPFHRSRTPQPPAQASQPKADLPFSLATRSCQPARHFVFKPPDILECSCSEASGKHLVCKSLMGLYIF